MTKSMLALVAAAAVAAAGCETVPQSGTGETAATAAPTTDRTTGPLTSLQERAVRGEIALIDAAPTPQPQFAYLEGAEARAGWNGALEAQIAQLCAPGQADQASAQFVAGMAIGLVGKPLSRMAVGNVAARLREELSRRTAAYEAQASARLEEQTDGLRFRCVRVTRMADGGGGPAFDLIAHISQEPTPLDYPRFGREEPVSGPNEVVVRPLRLIYAAPAFEEQDVDEVLVAVSLAVDSGWETQTERLQTQRVFDRLVVRATWPFGEDGVDVLYFDDPDDALGFTALRGSQRALVIGDEVTGPAFYQVSARVVEADQGATTSARRALYRRLSDEETDLVTELMGPEE